MRYLPILLLLAAQLVQGAADNLKDELAPAQKALSAGDYKRAHALYLRYAPRNPLAQFSLGLFEQQGWGRPANPQAACGWFEKAARGNIPAAQQLFGDCMASGIGRAADGPAAIEWYLKAAQTIHYAWCSAGGLYIAGKVVEKDVARGVALCTRAAQADSAPAMLRLADYYREGSEVPQDLAAARHWYRQAAERHSPEAQYRLGIMLAEGQGGEADLSTALMWLETAASQGHAAAYLPVAILYANVEVDPATGALRPEHLAKIYMWSSAAKAQASDTVQREQIARIEELVDKIMPITWKPELDKRVAEHLAKYPPPSASRLSQK